MHSATLPAPGTSDRLARLSNLGAAARLARYRAAHFPEEIPTVNGEAEWIAYRLADLD